MRCMAAQLLQRARLPATDTLHLATAYPGCRATEPAEGVRRRLAAVFQLAPECVEARVMEAELLLGERDFSGA